MLTGKAPFSGATAFAVASAVMHAERPQVRSVVPQSESVEHLRATEHGD